MSSSCNDGSTEREEEEKQHFLMQVTRPFEYVLLLLVNKAFFVHPMYRIETLSTLLRIYAASKENVTKFHALPY